MQFDKVLDAANWLGQNEYTERVSNLKKLYGENKYALTVWGHFSSGKSFLINNVIKRDLLPVRKTETTAALTYIMYGDTEQCRVIKVDGSCEVCAIEMVKDIYQKETLQNELDNIDHIEIEINCELLKSGLTLVDTPGINTLVKRHQELAFRAIEQSGQILYVLGGAPSNIDKEFIYKISESGIKITFIRTNCDRINPKEENPEETFFKEKETLREFIGEEPDIIYVSNLKSSALYKNIEYVRAAIKKISDNLEDMTRKAISTRLEKIISCLINELKQEKERLQKLENGDIKEIEKEIEKCNYNISELETVLSRRENFIKEKVREAGERALRNVNRLAESRVDNFREQLKRIKMHDDIENVIQEMYDIHLEESILKLESIFNDEFSGIIQDETIHIDYDDESEIPSYKEICESNSEILKQYVSQIKKVKNELEVYKKKCQDTELSLNEKSIAYAESNYEELMQEFEEQLKAIPKDTVLKLSEKQGIQPSEIFKHIGEVADLALLLIPGDVIAAAIKGTINTTKLAQTLAKSGKIGKVLINSANTVEKSAKQIDRVRDLAYTVNSVLGRKGYSTQKQSAKIVEIAADMAGSAYDDFKEQKREGNILDVLSVAYWTEKFGRNFDTLPKYEIDTEIEAERFKLRREITEQQKKLSAARIQQKKELGLLADQIKELEFLAKEKEETIKRITEEYAKKEEEVISHSKERALDDYKKTCLDHYEKNLNILTKKIYDEYSSSAKNNIMIYIALKNSDLIEGLENKKQHLKTLISDSKEKEAAIQEKMDICQMFLTDMEEMKKCES